LRNESRNFFISYVRKRLTIILEAQGESEEEIEIAKKIFDPKVLTIGFARRFATYKRPNMLLNNPERLIRILTNSQYPVQLVIAGKAHPSDVPGQELIRQWCEFVKRPEVRPHAVFLADYDMHMTERFVHGVDVWVNTPRRPWEACGTSGMKVLANGGLNLSELDGWWIEAYTPEVGWAIGDGHEHGDNPSWDATEANNLYDLLEKEVIPEFYNRNKEGIPAAWVARVRKSMSKLTPRYSADRAVIDYTEKYYIPAALAYRKRAENQGALAKQIVEWQHTLNQKWPSLRFGDVKVQTNGDKHNFEVQLFLGDLDPNIIKVELYADGAKNPQRQEMTCTKQTTRHLYLSSSRLSITPCLGLHPPCNPLPPRH
jgi:glycogen phosphorylase